MRAIRRTCFTVLCLLAAAFAAFVGCGSNPLLAADGAGGSSGLPANGPCAPEGTTRDCHEIVSQHDGIINCAYATQTCTNGAWSACGAGGDVHGATFSVGNKNLATGGQFLASGQLRVAGTLPRLELVQVPAQRGR
jgi:hypothetical protein